MRPGWLLNDTRLLGNPDEESVYDTGIDLTEADFIPDDTEAEPEATGYNIGLIIFVVVNILLKSSLF